VLNQVIIPLKCMNFLLDFILEPFNVYCIMKDFYPLLKKLFGLRYSYILPIELVRFALIQGIKLIPFLLK
jgi:hypothetical protein